MTTTATGTLPLDDAEVYVLTQSTEWKLTEVEETTRTDEESPAARAAELERLAEAFADAPAPFGSSSAPAGSAISTRGSGQRAKTAAKRRASWASDA